MRLFQNSGIYPTYRQQFDFKHQHAQTFKDRLALFRKDRYGASHILLPVEQGIASAFFTNGDDDILQRMWAAENGLSATASLRDILLTQIEAHQTEVFYNSDPMRYGSDFVRQLPGCVKKSVCWRAAPSIGADFSAYDRVVCNFPSIIDSWQKRGWHAAYLTPSHDQVMDTYASNEERPIDVLFIGGYSRHHMQRSVILNAVAQLSPEYRVVYCLDQSRVTRLADSPLGLLPGFSRHRRPASIRKVTSEPIFGRDLYQQISRAKIVLNGAIDMAGNDRGNMRCFESLGCGALMVSDRGRYPDGFETQKTMLDYQHANEAKHQILEALQNWQHTQHIARRGHQMIKTQYSKEAQWNTFIRIVE